MELETHLILTIQGAPYSVRLACKLLREKSLEESSDWFPYIQSLPLQVPCPLLEFTNRDLRLLDYIEIIDQFNSYKTMVTESWKKLDSKALGDADWDGYLWSMSIVHSRSFGTDGKRGPLGIHMLVPLVDMFNHGGDFCQGIYTSSKLKLDSAEWTLINPETSKTGQWEMDVKSNSRIEPNSQILMSYGERSNDDFFLYYGFIPPMNPNDDYVLFPSLDSALDWYIEQFMSNQDPVQVMKLKEEAKQQGESQEDNQIMQSSPSAEKEQLKLRIMSGGFVDGRLLAAFDRLSATTKITRQQAIKKRCWELIASHTCLIHDLRLLTDALPDSEHNFPFLLEFYSNAFEKFQQAGGELPASREAHQEESGDLNFSQKLIKTYMCYKRIILWDVLLNLNRTS